MILQPLLSPSSSASAYNAHRTPTAGFTRACLAALTACCLWVVLAGTGTNPARAADAAGYDGPKWELLDAKACLAAAAEVTLAKYPDCDDATVEQKSVRAYHSDGSAECQDESYTKVLTEKGKRNNRTLRLGFQIPYNTVSVIRLEVIDATGKVTPVDVAANSKEMIDQSQMAMNIFDPNSKILEVNIPQLEIGLVVHAVVRTTIQRSIIPGVFSETSPFEAPSLIRHAVYEVHSPADQPLQHILLRDEVPGTVHYTSRNLESQGTIHHWEVNNVGRMFDEPGMPPYANVLQRVAVSTAKDWPSVSKWYWELSKPHLDAITPEMKAKVAELTAGAKTDAEKVQALFHFVSRDIRYMGLTPEKDRPGFEPHDVSLTFNNKYGVCRDKAALLVSLLRIAGQPAYPILVNVGTKVDGENPDPGFNHAIVAVEQAPGQYQLMDPTAENTKDLLPSYDCDQSFIVCRPEGDKLRISPIFPATDNLMRIQTTATLDAQGTVNAKTQLSFEGINDSEYREAFSHMKPDDQRRFFEAMLKRVLPGSRLAAVRVTPADMANVKEPLHAELEFSVPGMTAAGGGKAVVNLPWIGKSIGIVSFILEGAGLEQRKYPLRTQIACGVREEVRLQLSPEFTDAVSMPSCVPVDDARLAYTRRVEWRDHALVGTGELLLKGVEFSPAEYLALKKTLQGMEYDQRKAPVLAATTSAAAPAAARPAAPAAPPVASNTEILDSRKTLEIKDAQTSVLKIAYVKKVLTYAGKKTESEIKLDYNPACQTARLVRAVVIGQDGHRQEIAAGEINQMDAGWNASAKRYTGGKTLVANLPGVDLGSTIEVELEVTTHGKPFQAGYEAFQLFDDLAKKHFHVTAPVTLPLATLVTGPTQWVHATAVTNGAERVLDWDATAVPALPAESQRPPEWAFQSGVEYYVGNWPAYLAELRTALLARSHGNPQAAALAARLAPAGTDRRAAVIAIRDFVAKSIRRAGPVFTDLPLTELSAADTTLADGYGHTADQAILLHSLLTAAGFAPEFVLASGLPAVPGITNIALTFPLPQTFTTPLVRVQVDGAPVYLNDTDQYARLGATVHEHRLGVDLASGAYEIIRPAAGAGSRSETDYSVTLADNGNTRIGITHRFYGTEFGGRNRYFSELPPEERRRYHQEQVSEVAQGARPVGELTTKFDTYPGTESFTVEIDSYAVADGRYYYFNLPFTPSLFPTGADRRTLPCFLGGQSEETVRTTIDLPPAFKKVVIAPPAADLHAPDGGGFARISDTAPAPGRRVLTHELTATPAIVSPNDYPALVDLEATLRRKSAKVFLLEKE